MVAGKVAVITGGASGIGAATVRRLADLGATVVVADIDATSGEQLLGELGAPHRFVHLDVTDLGAWRSVLAEVQSGVGPIDILFLNAGTMTRPPGAPSLDDPLVTAFDEAAYRRVMAVNVDGVVFGLMAALPLIEGRTVDVVVTVSALNGAAPDPLYGLSKLGLVGLVWGLAPNLAGRGIRLNAVCPALVDTPLISADIVELAGDFMQPAAYIADVVVSVIESPANGAVWFAAGPELGMWKVDPPSLPMPTHVGSVSGVTGWGQMVAPAAPPAAPSG